MSSVTAHHVFLSDSVNPTPVWALNLTGAARGFWTVLDLHDFGDDELMTAQWSMFSKPRQRNVGPVNGPAGAR